MTSIKSIQRDCGCEQCKWCDIDRYNMKEPCCTLKPEFGKPGPKRVAGGWVCEQYKFKKPKENRRTAEY